MACPMPAFEDTALMTAILVQLLSMLPHFRFTRQHPPLITPLCYLVEVVPYPFQFRDKFFDTVRIHDLLLQHTGKDILLLVLSTL